jgi:hypothetical protein
MPSKMTPFASPGINLTEDNEVTVGTRLDIEACKKPLYRTAVTILSNSRRQGTPSLAILREWLNIIVNQPATDFFLRNSKHAHAFKDLKKTSVLGCTSKTACYRRWTVNFITDKMSLLLELNKQVIREKKAREIATGKQGKAAQQKNLRWTIKTLVKRYDELLFLHNKAHRLEENACMRTPSLNYQNSGQRLQGTVLFNLMLWDLTACHVCLHLSTSSRQPGRLCRCFGGRVRRDIQWSVGKARMLLPRDSLLRAANWRQLSGVHRQGAEWQSPRDGWARESVV